MFTLGEAINVLKNIKMQETMHLCDAIEPHLSITMISIYPDDWVKESDIPILMRLINSKRKCNCITDPRANVSLLGTDIADVGGYAIIFINSFRNKEKIQLWHNCPKTNKKDVDDLTKWWTDYKKTK